MDLVANDPRVLAVPERDRRQVWEDYLVERGRRKKEVEKAFRKDHMERLLKDLEGHPRAHVNYTWRDFSRDFSDHLSFRALASADRLQVLQDFISPLEDAVEKRVREKKEALALKSRKAREAFRNLLKDRWVKGQITLDTRWADFVGLIRSEQAFEAMVR